MPPRDEEGPAGPPSGDGTSEPGHLHLVTPRTRVGVGELIRALRGRARPGDPKGLTVTEASRRSGLYGDTVVSPRRWSRIEHGHAHPEAGALLRMALAVDATPRQIRQLFHLAGYGHLYDTLAGAAGARRPHPAEAGILADPRLPHHKRRTLLEHVRDVVDALEVRARREESEHRRGPGPGRR